MTTTASLSPAVRRPPFFTVGRLAWAFVLYVVMAIVPPSALERPFRVARLLSSPAPEHVGVPVAGVAPSAVRPSWGAPRSGGRRHEGIDIFAPRGTRVVASVDGVVWRVGTDPLGGLVVLLLGAGGQTHYYAHLDRQADLRPGDPIAAGDTVGVVGTTGNARGGAPHLHYGIYGASGAIDPFPLLTRREPSATDAEAAVTPTKRVDGRGAPKSAPPPH